MTPSADQQNVRRLRTFTPSTPWVHPLLNPNIPEEDIPLVPQDLKPRGHLEWQLPQKTRTNLHIMLRLSSKADELIGEFHEKIPKIENLLDSWAEMEGASPTKTGEDELKAQSEMAESSEDSDCEQQNDGYVFQMARHLETPGSDVIYLTDGIEDSDEEMQDSIPSNFRVVDWQDSDGSNMHLTGLADRHSPPSDTIQTEPTVDVTESHYGRDSTPENLRSREWSAKEQAIHLKVGIYIPKLESSNSEIEHSGKQLGIYDEFWMNHQRHAIAI